MQGLWLKLLLVHVLFNAADSWWFLYWPDGFSSTQCPDGWINDAGHCYKGFSQRTTWNEASKRCQEEVSGGILACPKDQEQNEAVRKIVRTYKNKQVWLGLQQHLVWYDGSDVTYEAKWSKGRPHDKCVYMSSRDKQFQWFMQRCNKKYYFVCQIESEDSATDKPDTDKPVTEKTTTKKPTTEKPTTEKPTTEKPTTEKPVTEKPVTEKPVTEKPVTEKPTTKKPVTNKPDSTCDIKYQPFPGHTACLSKSPTAVPYEFSPIDKQMIVDKHNELRAGENAKNMMKMYWDAELEMMARKWADVCVDGHDDRDLRFIPGRFDIGQNLYYSWKHLDIQGALTSWWQEKDEFNYRHGVPISQQTYQVLHYTQMAWASTYKVGCAATHCPSGWTTFICNYGPAGNYGNFESPYDLSGPSQCAGSLCDCGSVECNQGDVIISTSSCTCDCSNLPFLSPPDCAINCNAGEDKSCSKRTKSDCTKWKVASKCPQKCQVCRA